MGLDEHKSPLGTCTWEISPDFVIFIVMACQQETFFDILLEVRHKFHLIRPVN